MRRNMFYVSLLIILILLGGCAAPASSVPSHSRWASVSGSRLDEAAAGEQFYFSILVDQGVLDVGIPVKIDVKGNVNTGSLRFELRQPDDQVVWDTGTIGPGGFEISTEYALPAGVTGTYTLGLVYSDNTSAMYHLSWQALKLNTLILLPGIGMILVSLTFVFYAARRRILGWRYLLLGALFWLLTVAAKFTFAIPVNPAVYKALRVSYTDVFAPGNLLAYLYIGALTGVFEAGLAWLILRKSRWGRASWNQALVFGIGFGMIEALLLGIVALGSALVGMLNPDALPVPTLGSLAQNATLVMGLAPVVERLSVIFAHIFACVLIFYAIARGEARWALLAVLYKTLLDAPAGFAGFWGISTPEKLWTIEAIVAVFGLIGLWGTILIARSYPGKIEPAAKMDALLV